MARDSYHLLACFMSFSTTIALLILHLSSASADHDYCDALRKSIFFFEGQRSGKLPHYQRLRWRRDSGLDDGASARVDLTGGYYDAGDNVKFRFPMAFTTTMLSWSVIEFGRNMMEAGELGNAVDAVKWGTDYLLKATAQDNVIYVQVGDPLSDHSCWERPEDMDTERTAYKIDVNNPGSEVAGETAAALAAASIVFWSRDKDYSRLLFNRAIKVFEFADKYRGAYSYSLRDAVCPFYCDYNGYEDELLWGAAWLYKASGRQEYIEYIVSNMEVLGAGDAISEFGWDNKHAGINVLLSKEVLMGGAEDLEQFHRNADGFICPFLSGISNAQVQYSTAISPNISLQVNAADVSDKWCGRTHRKADCLSIVMADKRANLKTNPNGLATILRDRAVATAVDTSLKIATLLKKATDIPEIATLRSCSADYFDTINTLTTADFKVMNRQTYPALVAVINKGNEKARDCEFSFQEPPAHIRSPITAGNGRLREICDTTLQIINLVVCNSVSSC